MGRPRGRGNHVLSRPREGTSTRAPGAPFTMNAVVQPVGSGRRTLCFDALPDLTIKPWSFNQVTRYVSSQEFRAYGCLGCRRGFR